MLDRRVQTGKVEPISRKNDGKLGTLTTVNKASVMITLAGSSFMQIYFNSMEQTVKMLHAVPGDANFLHITTGHLQNQRLCHGHSESNIRSSLGYPSRSHGDERAIKCPKTPIGLSAATLASKQDFRRYWRKAALLRKPKLSARRQSFTASTLIRYSTAINTDLCTARHHRLIGRETGVFNLSACVSDGYVVPSQLSAQTSVSFTR